MLSHEIPLILDKDYGSQTSYGSNCMFAYFQDDEKINIYNRKA